MKQPEYYQQRVTPHEREVPHRLAQGIWMWSVFNHDKGLHFNGHLLQTGDGTGVLVDPVMNPDFVDEILAAFAPLPRPTAIWLSNRDHERASDLFREAFNVHLYAHEADAPLLETSKHVHTYRDGDVMDGGWRVIHLPDAKSPGECAFYQPERRLLLLGDALIGHPMHELHMLPDEKFADPVKARQGLRKLDGLSVDAVLVGDGEPLFLNAQSILKDAIRGD